MDIQLQYYHFLSWAYENEALNQYQIEIKLENKEGSKDELNNELGSNFLSYTYLTPSPSEIIAFLEYQYDKYNNNKRDFIDFLRKFLSIPIPEHVQELASGSSLQIRRDDIQEWIDWKKDDFKFLNPSGNSKRTIYFYDYIDFICVKLSDEEKKEYKDYQLICNISDGKNCKPFKSESCRKEVNLFLEHDYYNYLFKALLPNQCWKFLDYHAKMYYDKNPEQGLNFIGFIQDTVSQMKYSKNPSTRALLDEPSLPNRINLINEWIEDRRKELQAEVKEPKTREYISHPQQILLFEKLGIVKYLKDKYKLNPGNLAKVISILSNRDFDNAKSYLRYVSLPKERIPTSKKNYDPKTPENIEFLNRTLTELGLSE